MEEVNWKPNVTPSGGSAEDIKNLPVEDYKPRIGPAGLPEELTAADDPLLTGFLQGASFGFWDELASKLEAMSSDREYRELWDERQKQLERYRKLAPWTMGTGEVGGAVLTSFLPGGILGKAAQGARVLETAGEVGRLMKILRGIKSSGPLVKTLAKQGAIYGIGTGDKPYYSEKYENPVMAATLGPAADALTGAADNLIGYGLMRGAVGLGGALASPIKEPVTKGTKWVLEKTAPLFRVPNTEARSVAQEVLADPDVYRGKMRTMKEIIKEDIEPMTAKLGQSIDEAKAKAASYLDDKLPHVTVDQIREIITSKLKGTKALTKDPDTGKLVPRFGGVKNMLDSDIVLAKEMAGKKGYLTEKQLHDFYEAIQSRGQYEKTTSNEVTSAYVKARGAINEILSKNKKYDNEMKFVREATDDIAGFKDALSIGKGLRTAKYEAPRATYGKLQQIRRNPPLEEVLNDFVSKYGGKSKAIAEIKRIRNESTFGLKRPSNVGGMSLPLMFGAMLTNSPTLGVAGGAAAAFDMVSPNLWRAMATRTGPGTTGMLTEGLSRAGGMAGINRVNEPEYIGLPLWGISAEEYLRRKQAAEEESRTD